ncbi:MAG TPA: carboxypeptidase-like regulatory domain-containing protein [Terriglobales bacterium]|nr:carboxypeptidase-like regulatory domain-containing protein [Terriglobales bacterium]
MRRVCVGTARSWSVLLQACVLLPSLAMCQTAPGYPSAGSGATYKLNGTVVNSVTGEPIGRTLVRLNIGGERLAFSDSSGHFEFDGLPAGPASVVVQKPGYFGEEQLENHRGRTPFVIIGPDSPTVSLKLLPQSVILGHIKGANGEPVEGVQVKIIASRIVEGRKRWQMIQNTVTNEDGEFRIANLQPGVYYLEAEPAGYQRQSRTRIKGYAPAFYPGAPDMSSATPLQLNGGQQAEIDLSLHSVTEYKVSGTLVGSPLSSGIQIIFIDHFGNQFSSFNRFNPVTGEFEAEIPAGAYTLEAVAWMHDGQQLRGELPVNVSGDLAGLVLTLHGSQPAPITVRAEGAAHGQELSRIVQIHLVRDGDLIANPDYWSFWRPGTPKPMFVLPDVPAGRYSVEVRSNAGSWYVQSAQCGSTDLLHEPLTVTSDGQIPPVEVVIRNDGATLRGHVNTREKQTLATVVLMPDDRPSTETHVITANPDGTFYVTGLPPDTYSVLALDSADGLEYTNPDVMQAYSSQAAHVTLQSGGQAQVSVELTHVLD